MKLTGHDRGNVFFFSGVLEYYERFIILCISQKKMAHATSRRQ